MNQAASSRESAHLQVTGLILAAAGSGTRCQTDTPKQFLQFQGRPLYIHSLEPFMTDCAQAVIVVPGEWRSDIASQVQSLPYASKLVVIAGGPTRQDSVYRGLGRLEKSIKKVLVHDASRPFVSLALIQRVLSGVMKQGACIPVLPARDTLKEVKGDSVVRTLDRQSVRLVQTPQGFERNLLEQAFQNAHRENFCATDESTLVERLGKTVHVVEGDLKNLKITWKEDLGGHRLISKA